MNSVRNISSPVSPFTQRPSQQTAYFSNAQLPTTTSSSGPSQASLALYPLTIPQPSQQSPVRTASPPQGSAWSQTSAGTAFSGPISSQQEMYSNSPYNNFASFTPQNQHRQASSLASPEAPALEYCQSATSSDMPSHRSSVCSYTSEASEMNMAAAKVEEQRGGWYSAQNEHILQRPGQMPYTQAHPLLQAHPDDLYRPAEQTADWSPQENKPFVSEIQTSNGGLPTFDMHPVLPSVTRIKKKRQRTTPEEATHECRVCHKLFKRSYNWKSHMETHNPDRKYPHPCTATVGNQQCTKKFQRKTDLDRHYDSVHLKARNHKCHLCGNRFARRDTLRRHTEDGCPKRFELGIRDAAMQQQQQQQQPQHQPQQQAHHPVHPQSHSIPQLHQPQPQPRWTYSAQVSMAPPMMPSHLSAPAFPGYAMPPPAVPYQA